MICAPLFRRACIVALAPSALLSALTPALAASPPAPVAAVRGAGVDGTVASVIDGDTVVFAPAKGKPLEVRLAGIDAPEICQDGGAAARAFLAEKVQGKPVRLVTGGPTGPDLGGRTAGYLFVDGAELNRLMVEEGQAHSIRVKFDQGPYVAQERMARALSRGVFKVGASSITPKDFRVRHGPCEGQVAAPASSQAPTR